MTFEEAIEKFRAMEQVEDVMQLVGKEPQQELLRKIVVAWPKVRINRAPTKTKPPEDGFALWDWLWTQVVIDTEKIAGIAGSGQGTTEKNINLLRGNRIIYPDGTVSSFATKALRQLMKSQLNI